MTYLVLFYTQSAAIKFHRAYAQKGYAVQMQPVPRRLSSSCGIAVKLVFEGDSQELVTVDTEKIYEVKGTDYQLVYAGE